jgi:hypothetical protein
MPRNAEKIGRFAGATKSAFAAVRCCLVETARGANPQSNGKLEHWHGSWKGEQFRLASPTSVEAARRVVASFVGEPCGQSRNLAFTPSLNTWQAGAVPSTNAFAFADPVAIIEVFAGAEPSCVGSRALLKLSDD